MRRRGGDRRFWKAAMGVLPLVWLGCSHPRIVPKPKAPPAPIRKVEVVPFDGPGGQEATDAFVRKLVGTGLELTDAHHPGDAVLKGSVTDYKPANTLMVFLGNRTLLGPGGKPVVIDNPIVSAGSSQMLPERTDPGHQNAQVAAVGAIVGISASLVEASSGRVLWSGRLVYEGLDMAGALESVAGLMTRSMGPILPLAPKVQNEK